MLGSIHVTATRILLLVIGACGAPPHGEPTSAKMIHPPVRLAWRHEIVGSFGEEDFAEQSAFSSERVVLSALPWDRGLGIEAIDVATGTRSWGRDRPGWLLHPPGRLDPLYVAPMGVAPVGVAEPLRIERLDPNTGAVLSTVTLQREATSGDDTRVVWSARYVLVIADGDLAAFDWKTGELRWHTTVSRDAFLNPPLVLEDRIYVPGAENVIIAIADGRVLARLPGACCTALASPDGHHVFLRAAVDQMLELDDALAVVRRLPTEVRATSQTHYVTLADSGPPVQVFRYGDATPVATLRPSGDDDFLGALAIDGTEVAYFAKRTGTRSYLRDVTTGQERTLDHDGPWYGATPIIVRPYLFSYEGNAVAAYVIGS